MFWEVIRKCWYVRNYCSDNSIAKSSNNIPGPSSYAAGNCRSGEANGNFSQNEPKSEGTVESDGSSVSNNYLAQSGI